MPSGFEGHGGVAIRCNLSTGRHVYLSENLKPNKRTSEYVDSTHIMSMNRRCSGIARCTGRSVFQVHQRVPVTLDDVRECIDASHRLNPKDKEQYFYANGVDYDHVQKYYETVLQMNKNIIECKSDITTEVGRKFGLAVATLFYIFVE